jgi:hypothetical protein
VPSLENSSLTLNQNYLEVAGQNFEGRRPNGGILQLDIEDSLIHPNSLKHITNTRVA